MPLLSNMKSVNTTSCAMNELACNSLIGGANLHKSTIPALELTELFKEIEVALVQEPPVHKGKVVSFPGLIPVAAGDSPRAAIVTTRNSSMTPISFLSHRDMMCAVWKRDKLKVVLVSFYSDRTATLDDELEALNKVVEYATRKGLPLVIHGDFNAHSPLWGSPDYDGDGRGETVEEFISINGLIALNDGTPTWRNVNSFTHIDITMINNAAKSFARDWSSKFELSSDHALITLKLPPAKRDMVWATKSTNWANYMAKLSSTDWEPPELWTADTVEKEANDITDLILRLWKKYTRKKVRSPFNLKWWTDALTASKKASHRAAIVAEETKEESDKIILRNLRAAHKKLVRGTRSEAWYTFIENTTSPRDLANLTREANPGAKLGLLKREDGSIVDEDDLGAFLMDTHAPESHAAPERSRTNKKVRENQLKRFSFITKESLKAAFAAFGKKKRPGPDKLTPEMLQHLPDNVLERFVWIMKYSLCLSYVPDVWIESEVIFIPKLGKTDYANPRAFRPITLQSFVFKAQEKLSLWRLQDTYFRRRPFHQSQHAFRTGRSCDSALAATVDCLQSSIAKKEYALALFIDIKGAFDNLSQRAALKCMKEREMPCWFISFYKAYLNDRIALCNVNGAKERRTIPHGSPQGGVFSPTFWNIAFDELLSIINDGTFTGIGFADDANAIIRGKDLSTLYSLMQHKINEITAWAVKYGVSFCPKKTTVVLFTHKRPKYDSLPRLRINGEFIEQSRTVKYLGVILDSRLSFRAHIAAKIKEAKGSLMRARNKITASRGPRPSNMRWIYKCVALPALTYACHVWWYHAKEGELRKLSRLACLLIAPVLHNTPTAGMEVIYDLPPLDLLLKREAMGKFINIHNSYRRVWSGYDTDQRPYGFYAKLEKLIQDAGILPAHTDYKKNIVMRRTFSVSLARDVNPSENGIVVFTDGSKMEGGVGLGHHISGKGIDISESRSLYGFATVFQAEVAALIRAADHLIALAITDQQISVYSDSMASLMAIKAMHSTSELVREAKFKWNHLGSKNDVTLHWVKAHVGIEGNERADDLAKEGINSPLYSTKISRASIKSTLDDILLEEWSRKWKMSPDYQDTKRWFPDVIHPHRGKMTCLSRTVLGKITQFITSFNNMNHHTNRKDKRVSPVCRLCKIPTSSERPWHIVTECPGAELLTRVHLNSFIQDHISWSIAGLAGLVQSPPIAGLMATRSVHEA